MQQLGLLHAGVWPSFSVQGKLATESSFSRLHSLIESEHQESTQDTYELHDDDPVAVDAMLCYIYAVEYPGGDLFFKSKSALWERHLNVAIVADKYGLPQLERRALERCLDRIIGDNWSGDVDLLYVIERSMDYPDRTGKLTETIVELVDKPFMKLFKDARFRDWVDDHAAKTKVLVAKHFAELMKLKIFRAKLEADGALAVKHLDRVLEESQAKIRRLEKQRPW